MKSVSNNSRAISDLNKMSCRQAMGLSENYQTNRVDGYQNEFAKLNQESTQQLLYTMERHADLKIRFAAGQLLGLRGDPRLMTLDLVRIEGAEIKVGLRPELLDPVAASLSDIGVEKNWIAKECPSRAVEVKSFAIGRYPVTNLEYRNFLIKSGWRELPTSWIFGIYPADRANHPVYTVTPEAADAYCDWLTQESGRKIRLPSEVEWEYAAAGPRASEYPWGDEFKADLCNTVETEIYSSTPVGMFPESNSVFGISDLAGNVEEYVSNDYAPYPGGEVVPDDLLLKFGKYRVARGGSFTRYRDLARCKRRHGRYDKEIYVMGFRIAESV